MGTGHTYTTTVAAPTCTEGGYTVYTCACGHSYQGNETPATGHTYTTTVVAPTCTTAGYTLHECACGDSYQDNETAATGHTYTTTVVEATCIAAGYTLHECECGDSYQSDGVAALGHNYKNSVCTRCGQESLFGPGITKPTFPSLPGIGNSSMLSANGQVIEATIVQIYDYVYNGGSLTQMTVTTTVDGEEASIDTLYFAYASGTPMSVTYNDEVYYYVTNLQGDVTALLDTDGVMVVEYTYDAWGNPLSITGDLADTLGQANPLRYRGYVYDSETGLYYLQSRYYDPELGRFLNADAFASTGQGILGNNMFAYCLNNPIRYIDPKGSFALYQGPVFEKAREIAEEYLEQRERHLSRNEEQDKYLQSLKNDLGSEAKLIEYIKAEWEEQDTGANLFHICIVSPQGLEALYNVKYMSPDGRYEVIICDLPNNPYIVTNSVNKGTSNYGTDGGIEHAISDVFPYFLWGNSGWGVGGDVFYDMLNGWEK